MMMHNNVSTKFKKHIYSGTAGWRARSCMHAPLIEKKGVMSQKFKFVKL